MALDFPNIPALDEEYDAPNGTTYKWNGSSWDPVCTSDGGSSSVLAASEVAYDEHLFGIAIKQNKVVDGMRLFGDTIHFSQGGYMYSTSDGYTFTLVGKDSRADSMSEILSEYDDFRDLYINIGRSSYSRAILTSPTAASGTWNFLPTTGLNEIRFFASSPTTGTYVATKYTPSPEIYRSTDGGSSWTAVNIPGSTREKMRVFATSTGAFLAEAGDSGSSLANGELWRSGDDGQTWSQVYDSVFVDWFPGSRPSFIKEHDGKIVQFTSQATGKNHVPVLSLDDGNNWFSLPISTDKGATFTGWPGDTSYITLLNFAGADGFWYACNRSVTGTAQIADKNAVYLWKSTDLRNWTLVSGIGGVQTFGEAMQANGQCVIGMTRRGTTGSNNPTVFYRASV